MADTFEGLTVKFGANTVEFDASVKGMNKALTGLRKEFQTLSKDAKFDPENIETLNKQLVNLQEQARLSGLKIQELKKQQAALGEEKVGTQEWNNLQLEIDKTEGKLKTINRSIDTTSSKISDIGDTQSIYNLNKALDDVAVDLDLVNRKLELDPSNVELAERRMELLGQQASLSEQKIEALRQKQAELGDENIGTDEWKNLQREIDETEIGAMETQRAINGVGDEIEEADTKAKSFRDTFLGSFLGNVAAQAFQAVTGAISNLAGEAVEANDSLAKFASTMKFAGFNDSQITKAKNSVKDYADSTVYELSDVSNTTAQLAANGISNFTELTQAAGNLNAIAGGSADTFKSVGLVLTQTAGAGKLTTENWNQLANAIPGASGKIQEALKKNGAYTDNFRDAMADGEITAEEFNQALLELGSEPVAVEAAKSTKTFEGAIGNLKATVVTGINDIIESIGSENITGAISAFGESVKSTFEFIKNMIDFIKENKEIIITFAAAIGAGAAAFAGYSIITTVINSLKAFKAAQEGATLAQAALNAVMKANPIGLIITAIAALTAGLVYFFTKTETGQKILAKFSDWLKNTFSGTIKWLGEIWQSVSNTIINVWTKISGTIIPIITRLISGIENLINGFIKFWSNAWQGIVENTKTALNNLNTIITTIFNEIKEVISTIWEGIKTLITNTINAIILFIQTALNNLNTFITTIFTTIKTSISTIWEGIKTVITNAINAIKNNIQTNFNNIKSIITNAMNTVKATISSAWSAIKGFFSSGVSGIISTVTGIGDKIAAFFKGLPDKIKNAIGNLASIGKWIIDSIIKGLGNLASRLASSIGNAISSAVGLAKNAVSNKGFNGSIGDFGGAIQGMYRVKAPNMPAISTGATNNNNTLNIHVDANNATGLEIARAIEKQIVRRLSK